MEGSNRGNMIHEPLIDEIYSFICFFIKFIKCFLPPPPTHLPPHPPPSIHVGLDSDARTCALHSCYEKKMVNN